MFRLVFKSDLESGEVLMGEGFRDILGMAVGSCWASF